MTQRLTNRMPASNLFFVCMAFPSLVEAVRPWKIKRLTETNLETLDRMNEYTGPSNVDTPTFLERRMKKWIVDAENATKEYNEPVKNPKDGSGPLDWSKLYHDLVDDCRKSPADFQQHESLIRDRPVRKNRRESRSRSKTQSQRRKNAFSGECEIAAGSGKFNNFPDLPTGLDEFSNLSTYLRGDGGEKSFMSPLVPVSDGSSPNDDLIGSLAKPFVQHSSRFSRSSTPRNFSTQSDKIDSLSNYLAKEEDFDHDEDPFLSPLVPLSLSGSRVCDDQNGAITRPHVVHSRRLARNRAR